MSGNNGLGYPDIDMGQNPPTPSELVYINNIYPPQSNILVGQLWTQTTNILPIQGNYEPIPPTPSEPIYIEIPIQLSKILENRKSRTSFDSFTVAEWLWKYPEPFQPWTPPKLEPSWWEGFKLPFNVLELDEDAPIAIQRNFKEIEHYINFLGRTSGEIKDNLELLATAPGPALS